MLDVRTVGPSVERVKDEEKAEVREVSVKSPSAEHIKGEGTAEACEELVGDEPVDGEISSSGIDDSVADEVDVHFVAPPNGKGRAGVELDIGKLSIKWKAGERGSQMQKGGFGYVYFGSYDASDFAGAAHSDVKVVVKLPTADEDAVCAFEREALINQRIASFGGMSGVAEYLGSVDLSGVDSSLLPAAVGGTKGLVWRQVMGKTLDSYFDRRGGMSPMLATTLDVRASAPVKLPGTGDLSYIKVDLATKGVDTRTDAKRRLQGMLGIHNRRLQGTYGASGLDAAERQTGSTARNAADVVRDRK